MSKDTNAMSIGEIIKLINTNFDRFSVSQSNLIFNLYYDSIYISIHDGILFRSIEIRYNSTTLATHNNVVNRELGKICDRIYEKVKLQETEEKRKARDNLMRLKWELQSRLNPEVKKDKQIDKLNRL